MVSTQISRFLNKEHWISASELSLISGIDERIIRDIVNEEIDNDNIPIISGNDGYKIANNYEEAKRYACRLIAHGSKEIRKGNNILRCFEKEEQLTLKI